MKLILDLTKDEIDLLEDVLSNYTDKGPISAGWQSAQLISLNIKISETINSSHDE